MIADEELFYARRLGYGLKPGESIDGSVRDWAIGQLGTVPPLGYYGPDGNDIIAKFDFFQDAAAPADFYEACKQWGYYVNLEREYEQLSGKMPEDEWRKKMEREVWLPRGDIPYWRDCMIRSLTAVNGPSPVFERFWTFWVNHFTVSAPSFTKLLYGAHTRAIRNRMTGGFNEMLRDAILNPAMLFYLDNFISTGPNSEIARYSHETINENLAREVLELHTMSPAGGYTQEDVIEAAYALSGWGLYGATVDEAWIPGNPYGARFEDKRHEPGKRTILGKTYSNRNLGMNQAPEMLDDLARHPETVKHISWKLARHFIADEPPEDSVGRIRAAWNDTDGDLVAIHTAVVDEVIAKAPDHRKFTTPETWLYQAHRMTGLSLPDSRPWARSPWINAVCEELGQSYNECAQPNGWPEVEADWVSKELLDRRVRYGSAIGVTLFGDKGNALVRDIAVRLAGEGSALVAAIDGLNFPSKKLSVLLASPDFLRI